MRKIINLFFVVLFWPTFIVVSFLTLLFWVLRINAIRRAFRDKKLKAVLYMEVLPPLNAGYEYRSNKWAEILNENKIKAKVITVFNFNLHERVTKNEYVLPLYYIIFCWKRFFQCFYAFKYDLVIVRRELLLFNDYGDLFMEKFLRSINDKLIHDFDDNIIISKNEPRPISWFGKLMLEDGQKFTHCLSFYNYFLPGSSILKKLILKHHKDIDEKNINVIPTCVDYEKYLAKEYTPKDSIIKFGWIGGTYNLPLLHSILPALESISKTVSIKLIVVSGAPLDANVNFEIENVPWVLKNDHELIKQFDIGVMPLAHNAISEGKCGFKLIQYMGIGVVSIASRVGVNGQIISDGIDGFLVNAEHNWEEVILNVVNQRHRFKEIGENARKKILMSYSFKAYTEEYLNNLNFVNESKNSK